MMIIFLMITHHDINTIYSTLSGVIAYCQTLASSVYSLVSSSVTDCKCGHVLHSWPLGTVMENGTSLEIRTSVKSTGHYHSFI